MFFKIILLAVLLVGGNCRYFLVKDYGAPLYLIEDPNQIDDVTGHENAKPISFKARVRREADLVGVNDHDGVDTSVKIPLDENNKNLLIATGRLVDKHAETGLILENADGHSLSILGKHNPDVGDQLTAAGKAKLLHSDKQDLNANAFFSRNMPNDPGASSSNTFGGGLEYTHIDGHSLSVSGKHNSDVGEQLAAAGKAKILHSDKHDLTANAFINSNMPNAPGASSTSTFGGGLDYIHNYGHSLSLSGKHIPDFGEQLTAAGKATLLHSDKQDLSANAFITRNMPNGPEASSSNTFGGGLDYKHNDGHSLSLSGKHIPDFGDQLSAAGKVNLHTDKHDLNANAFITRNMPNTPGSSSYNSFGGGLDYTYDKIFGASLGVTQMPLFQRTDVSALGHLNLHREPNTNLDFFAGASRSFSPLLPQSSWEPKLGFVFTKRW